MNVDYIKHGDCLELMDELPDGSIDMVLCDLPYGVLNRSNKDAEWDVPINMEALWTQYKRVLKPNGAVVLFGQGMFTADLMQSNRAWWKYNLIWDKERTSGFLNARKQPLRCHEDIIVFYNSQPTYNPQMTKCPPHLRNHDRGRQEGKQTNRCYGSFGKAENIISDEKYPRSIVAIPQEHSNVLHPTQKPVNLLGWLIKTYSQEGGGSSRQLHGQWQYGHSRHQNRSPLHRLRVDRKILQHCLPAREGGAVATKTLLI